MERTCLDCGLPLEPIRVMDSTSERAYGMGLKFTSREARRSIWTSAYDAPVGEIHTWMCPLCGGVRLYAELGQGDLPRPSAPPEPDTAALPRPAHERGKGAE